VTSIIIPAHNEGCRIGTHLSLLTKDLRRDEFEIIVVANGCTDNTAAAAKAVPGVHVVELAVAGKAAALRAGDEVASRLARVYLDADVPLTSSGARALAKAVSQYGMLAATGRRRIVTRGSSLMVRAYYAVNSRLPVYDHSLFGRGVVALGPLGRARFDEFPEVIADDLFLDSLFEPHEKCQVDEVVTTIAAPRGTIALIRRIARVRAGNRALARSRPPHRTSWLRHVVLPRPWLWPAAVCYVAVILAAEVMSRRATLTWGSS